MSIKASTTKEGWKKLKFSEFVLIDPREILKKGMKAKHVAMDDISTFTRKVKSFDEKDFSGGSKFRNDDTLFARITPCLENGKTALVSVLDKDEIAFGSTEFIVFRAIEGVSDSKFIYYFSISDNFRGIAIKSMTGTSGRRRVQIDAFRNKEFLIPEYGEQKKIAEILGTYDDLIEVNQKKIKILEDMAQTIYKEWFVKPVKNGFPDGWEVEKIRDIYNVKYGKTLPKTLIKPYGPFPVYGAGGVIGFYENGNCFERTTLITSRGNGSGTVWRTKGSGFITNNSFIITSRDNYSYINFSFIFHSLLNASIMSEVTGAAQPQLTIENINYVEILIPKKEMIINYQDKVDYFYNEIDNLYLINQNLQKTRDLLIPQLVGGRISSK